MEHSPNQETNPALLSPEEHERLITRHTELLSQLDYLKQQREMSDETAHTEPLMDGEMVNERFIDRGWTAQIEDTEKEISDIETKIANHVHNLSNTTEDTKQGDLPLE